MKKSPSDKCWISRFPDNLTDEKIRERVAVNASPILDLGSNSASVDSIRLEKNLKSVYAATPSVCTLLKRFVQIGHAHAVGHFPDITTYVKGLYVDSSSDNSLFPYCLTGHSGVGKSQLLKALGRLLGEFENISIAGIDGIRNVPYWHVGINRQVTIGELFIPILQAAHGGNESNFKDGENKKNVRPGATLERLKRQAHREGVCLMGVDELQFMTVSQDATNLITRLLYQCGIIGPRLIYSSNFSLIHSIKRRPDQDRQRLLSNPLLMHPNEYGSEDWNMTLAELFKVAPDIFELTGANANEALHHYTFGINRRLVDLLVLAYRMQRENKKHVVKLEHIERAQRSAQFSDHRETVNALIQLSINKSSTGKVRKDLLCPFEFLADISFERADETNVHHAEKIKERKAIRVQDDALRASLTADERKIVNDFEGASKKSKNQGNVFKIPRPKVLSKASLLEGDAAFNEMM